ncbi:MAG: carboxylating nicotinate-nucleotide diphosphorylase [Chloroflexota bacterium]|nr:carboxylating nicotinate-nucleotide diphosphorylase [Chloroflexota bacterium]
MGLNSTATKEIINLALVEDQTNGDVTTNTLIPSDLRGNAFFCAKASGILAGINIIPMVYHQVDETVKVKILFTDGNTIQPGDMIASVEGRAASILRGERVSLNLLQHLCGIATETSKYVRAVDNLPARILDTRKTTPGIRLLQKYAVRMGGGHNHRAHLADGILIKDNHIAILKAQGMTLKDIVSKARSMTSQFTHIEVEVRTGAQALEALEAGANMIMLDNMSIPEMRQSVRSIRNRCLVEASGGITLNNVREVAKTGVDFISIGALTHSASALDISLKWEYVEDGRQPQCQQH